MALGRKTGGRLKGEQPKSKLFLSPLSLEKAGTMGTGPPPMHGKPKPVKRRKPKAKK